MSVQGKRDYRPRFHYTPEKGWINDPNGLVFDGEKYHLFAQHNPYYTHHDLMYWAHAVSYDLIHWERLPIGISPDKNGDCWSGSACVIDGNVALMYTSAGDAQAQSVAFSKDNVNFVQYEGNPVIKNPGFHDFRDPKIFYNDKYGCYGVAVASGDHVRFYISKDLISWQETGRFSDQEKITGIHECPDVFPLTAPDGEKVYCMIASMIKPQGGNMTEYALGDFDGDKFILTKPFDRPEPIDHGWDMYAPVTFYGLDEKIMIGWAEDWRYAHKQPTNDYAGCMSCARKLGLIETEKGLRLTQTPILDAITGEYEATDEIKGEAFRISLEADGDFELKLANDFGEEVVISREGEKYIVDRKNAGEWGEAVEMANECGVSARERVINGMTKMDICFDKSILEVFADAGSYFSTTLVFPTRPYTKMIAKNCAYKIALLA